MAAKNGTKTPRRPTANSRRVIPRDFESLADTAERVHISERTLRQRGREGAFKVYTPPGTKRVLVRPSDVDAWILKGLVRHGGAPTQHPTNTADGGDPARSLADVGGL